VSTLGLAACGKSDERPEGAPSGERTKEPVPETPKDAPTGPFAGFDFEKAKQAWQGAWVLEGEPEWVSWRKSWPGTWYGVARFFRWLETKAYKMHVRVLLSKYRSYDACRACSGARLRPAFAARGDARWDQDAIGRGRTGCAPVLHPPVLERARILREPGGFQSLSLGLLPGHPVDPLTVTRIRGAPGQCEHDQDRDERGATGEDNIARQHTSATLTG